MLSCRFRSFACSIVKKSSNFPFLRFRPFSSQSLEKAYIPIEDPLADRSFSSAIVLSVAISSLLYGSYHAYDLFFDYPEPVKMIWDAIQEDPKTVELFGNNIGKWRIWHGFVDENIASIKIYVHGTLGEGIVRGELARTSKHGWEIISMNGYRTDSQKEIMETGFILNPWTLRANATGKDATAPLTDDVIAGLTGYSVGLEKNVPTSMNACPAGHGSVKVVSNISNTNPPTNTCPAGHGSPTHVKKTEVNVMNDQEVIMAALAAAAMVSPCK